MPRWADKMAHALNRGKAKRRDSGRRSLSKGRLTGDQRRASGPEGLQSTQDGEVEVKIGL